MEKESGLGLNDAIDLASKGQKQIGVYPCPFAGCSLEYKTRSALIRHLRTHTANNAPIQLQTRSKSDLHKPKKRPRRASAAEAPLDGLFGSGVGTRSSRSKKAKRGASTAFGAGGPGRGRESKRAGNAETSGNVEGDDGESGDKSRVGGSDVDESENSSGRDVPSPAVIASHAEYFAKQLCAARSRKVDAWQLGDYQNAHRWALWLKDNLDDTKDKDKESVTQALATKGLSFEAIESAEAHLFEAVVADERIDEEKLGFAASVAADADVVEETPNRSLGLLADCVAAAVTRQAVAKRLASALCRLGSSNEGGVAGTFVQGLDSPSSDAVVGRATQIGRAHVVLERLAELPLASRKARLDRLVSCGKPSEVVLACDILAHRHATSNPAKKAVSDDILARLLAFDNTRKADELWNLNDSILGTLCEKYFPIFQGYLNFLLGRLRVALWEAWLSDAAVVDVAASAQRGSSSPATSPARTAHNQSVYGRLQEIADADCVEARLLICKVDQKRTPQEVLGEVEKRIKLLFNCCSPVPIVGRLVLSDFASSLPAPLRTALNSRCSSIARQVCST